MTSKLVRRLSVSTIFAGLLTGACGSPSTTAPSPPAGLTADFTAAGTLTQRFTDKSSGGTIVSWDWDFGDGSVHDKTQSPGHTYSPTQQSRNFTVTLVVSDDKGKTASKPQQITVVPAVEVLFDFDIQANPGPMGNPQGICPKPVTAAGTVMVNFTIQATEAFVVQVYLEPKVSFLAVGCDSRAEVCPNAIGSQTQTATAFTASWSVVTPDTYCLGIRNRGTSNFVAHTAGMMLVH